MNYEKPQNIRSKCKLTIAALLALCLTAASCGISDAKTAEGTTLGAQNAPEHGDSIDAWLDPDATSKPVEVPAGHELFEWEDLTPPGSSGEAIYNRYEERLAAVEIGSPESNALYAEMQAEADSEGEAINTELDGKKIHMGGFVTPLSYDDDVVTEFLLVPYFGACIHVPAPPPNQTIMVKLAEGESMSIEDTWGAVWITGTLTATSATTDLAEAGYTITGATSTISEGY